MIAVQLYSVREAIADDLEETLARLAGVGFTAVEPYSSLFDQPDRYAAALAANGLTAVSVHAPVLDADDPARFFDAAAALGIPVVIEPAHRGDWTTADGVAETAEKLNRAARQAAASGLTLGYHNHWWELEARPDGTPALELAAAQLDPAVILEVDTYWAEVGGVRAVDLLQRLGDRVRFIHVKDGPVTQDTAAQLPAGRGAMDVPAVLAAAPRATRVLEFDDYAGDVIEGLAESYAFVTAQDLA